MIYWDLSLGVGTILSQTEKKHMGYKPVQLYQEITVNTLEEIYDTIDEYNRFHNLPRAVHGEGNPLLQAFYRGQNNSEWDISPSILRSDASEHQIPQDFQPPKELSLFGTIAYIQHYHSGTRFIDFSTNPDIAIFFACDGNNDKDGAIFIYDYVPHRAQWYSALVLSELTQLVNKRRISVQYLAEQVLVHNPDLKDRFQQIEDLNGAIISFLDHGFMVLPDDESLQDNLRLQRQQGCFFMCGVKFEHALISSGRWFSRAGRKEFNPKSVNVPNSLKSGWSLAKITIPKESKGNMLQLLASKGITRDYLFPD